MVETDAKGAEKTKEDCQRKDEKCKVENTENGKISVKEYNSLNTEEVPVRLIQME